MVSVLRQVLNDWLLLFENKSKHFRLNEKGSEGRKLKKRRRRKEGEGSRLLVNVHNLEKGEDGLCTGSEPAEPVDDRLLETV